MIDKNAKLDIEIIEELIAKLKAGDIELTEVDRIVKFLLSYSDNNDPE